MKSAALILTLLVSTTVSWSITNPPLAGENHDPATHGSTHSKQSGAVVESPNALNNLHGGIISDSGKRRFETMFGPDGVRVYMYSSAGNPMMIEHVSGWATLKFKNGANSKIQMIPEAPGRDEESVYFCPMHENVVRMKSGVCDACGGMKLMVQNRLSGKVDLSKVTSELVGAEIQIEGFEGPESRTNYSVKYEAPEENEIMNEPRHSHSNSGHTARGGCGMGSGH